MTAAKTTTKRLQPHPLKAHMHGLTQ